MISESGETVYLKRTPQAKKDSMNRAETTKIAGYFQKANLSVHAMSCLPVFWHSQARLARAPGRALTSDINRN